MMEYDKKDEYILELEDLENDVNQDIDEEILDLDILDIAFSYGEHRTHTDD